MPIFYFDLNWVNLANPGGRQEHCLFTILPISTIYDTFKREKTRFDLQVRLLSELEYLSRLTGNTEVQCVAENNHERYIRGDFLINQGRVSKRLLNPQVCRVSRPVESVADPGLPGFFAICGTLGENVTFRPCFSGGQVKKTNL